MASFFQRLTLAQKYAIIGLLILVVILIPTSVVISEKLADARQAGRSAAYLAPATQTLESIRLSQQVRGLSNAFLNGNNAAIENLERSLQAANQAHVRADEYMAEVGVEEPIRAALRNLGAQIHELGVSVRARELMPADSFQAYSGVIDEQLAVLGNIISATGLDLDAHPDSYALIKGLFGSFPVLTEQLGRARGLGAGILARGAGTEGDRLDIGVSLALAADALRGWEDALTTATQQDAQIDSRLSSILKQTSDETRRVLALADQALLSAGHAGISSGAYFDTMTKAIDSQFQLAEQVSALLGELLETRAAHASQQLWALIAGLALLILTAFLLATLINRNIVSSLHKSLEVARTVAQGNLTTTVQVNGADEVQQLLKALNEMTGSLISIVAQVRGATDNIATAANQIAAGNQDLSERTVSQAASLEETAASMEQLASTVMQNSENARTANTLTRNATEIAHRCGDAVQQFVTTMSAIRETSSSIGEIVTIIDSIAFQTNILALNAAVEAARAGEAGKGFAVVASEVRSLAQRSANSAREIRELIEQSAAEIDTGSKLADSAGATMHEVLESIEKVSQLMKDIAIASTEQGSGIAQVNIAVGEMDGVTQQNAALVEEAATAAASLREQADMLVLAVSAFRLPGSDPSFQESGV